VVGGRVVVVVVAVVVVVVGGRVVVVVVVEVVTVVEVVVVVVVMPPVTTTEQPLAPVMGIATALVSKRLRISRPMSVEPFAVGATSNVTVATLTTPVGPLVLNCCKPEIGVEPLVKVDLFVVGLVENSGVLPPTTDAIVTVAGSYVIVIP
jgi:hypothetical protein